MLVHTYTYVFQRYNFYYIYSLVRKTFSWSVKPTVDNPSTTDNGPALDVWVKDEPDCPLNNDRVGGSRPLRRNFEIFARNQNRWIQAFIPTFEKMMANGYER